jgi:hypothetical protein
MIIFGTRSTLLLKERLFEKCHKCGSSDRIDMYIYQQYAHVFWIPFFPSSKQGISECTSCKERYEARYMPSHLLSAFLNVRDKTKTPFWTFGFIGLLAIGIAAGVYFDIEDTKKDAQYILSPKEGDEYEVKTNDDTYTLNKVVKIDGDSITLLLNRWETDELSGLSKIKDRDNRGYSDETMTVTRRELKEMWDEDRIVEVER